MPPLNHPSLQLQVLPHPFFVVQLKADAELPPCIIKDITYGGGRFFSITRTNEETSLVGESRKGMPDNLREHSTWMCIKVLGPMEHNIAGALADLTGPLKAAKVPVFVSSTWNTDYVLVPTEMLTEAIGALERDGWNFVQTGKSRDARL